MPKSQLADADRRQDFSRARRAVDKPVSLLDALRDPNAIKGKDFEPDRVTFVSRDVNSGPLR